MKTKKVTKSKKTKPLRGKELLRAAVNQIIDHPELWSQGSWHCGSSHCVGGWCQVLAGLPESSVNARKDATKLVGLNAKQANYLFNQWRTLQEIYDFAKAFIAGKKWYDRSRYDCYGYDCDGYGRSGYDRSGYGRSGYDRSGYDRYGYDRDGFNRDGYDRDGFNRDGYDRNGFNRKKKRLAHL